MPDWPPERIAAEPTDRLKNLRANAERLGEIELANLCDEELARRVKKPAGPRRVKATESSKGRSVVGGFHFVSSREWGLTMNGDGTAWTGTWVVDTRHAETGVKIGAYVALHATKLEPSYLQGIVRDWRAAKREREYAEGTPVRIDKGIDFLIELTSEPYKWQGDGSGEKGYFWTTPE